LLSRVPDLTKAWKKYTSSGDSNKDKFIGLLKKTADRFRSLYTVTKPGLRKVGYRDLSMIDNENEAKVLHPAFGVLKVVFRQFRTIQEYR
jgi:hypothetical protein